VKGALLSLVRLRVGSLMEDAAECSEGEVTMLIVAMSDGAESRSGCEEVGENRGA
jgi:hypothetical protein